MVIDPHTAVGLEASGKYLDEYPNDIVVTLATAHPSKFSQSVNSILGLIQTYPLDTKIFKLKRKLSSN